MRYLMIDTLERLFQYLERSLGIATQKCTKDLRKRISFSDLERSLGIATTVPSVELAPDGRFQ